MQSDFLCVCLCVCFPCLFLAAAFQIQIFCTPRISLMVTCQCHWAGNRNRNDSGHTSDASHGWNEGHVSSDPSPSSPLSSTTLSSPDDFHCQVYKSFVWTFISSMYSICRDMNELILMGRLLWLVYIQPFSYIGPRTNIQTRRDGSIHLLGPRYTCHMTLDQVYSLSDCLNFPLDHHHWPSPPVNQNNNNDIKYHHHHWPSPLANHNNNNNKYNHHHYWPMTSSTIIGHPLQ